MNSSNIKLIDSTNKKLRKKSTNVTDFENPKYKEIIEEMRKICISEKAYASAAPQFGILKRFILIMTIEEIKVDDVEGLEKAEINYAIKPYFNPRIVKMIGKQCFYEACMSVKEAAGKVTRPYYIKLEAQDINGNFFTKEASGFEAIILCHEIDHLDGIEFTDKAEDMHYNVTKEDKIKLRKKYPHEIISESSEFNQDNIKEEFKTLIYKERLIF